MRASQRNGGARHGDRNARPFELALVVAACVSVQGAPVLDALADPAATLTRHAIALPLAALVLVAEWRPLVARAG